MNKLLNQINHKKINPNQIINLKINILYNQKSNIYAKNKWKRKNGLDGNKKSLNNKTRARIRKVKKYQYAKDNIKISIIWEKNYFLRKFFWII